MEKEKYYQPDISELYVGYECETQVDPYPDYVHTVIEDGDCFNFIINNDWRIRSKYLDSDDIVSLGFDRLEVVDVFFGKNNYLLKITENSEIIHEMDGFKVGLLLKHEQGKIRIEKQMFGGFTGTQKYNEQVYYGPCKSKNELKTILSWIK